jgi:hypothetical protein
MKFYHDKLGNCKVLIEANHEGKCFKLVESTKTKKEKRTYGRHWSSNFEWVESKTTYHYMLWGNTQDENEMGVTKLVSPTGRKVKQSRAIKLFFDAMKAAKEMTFSK